MSNTDAQLESALSDVTAVLARDGFTSAWTTRDGKVAFRVRVGTADCADCLAPEPVLRLMIENALKDTAFELERVEMPELDG